MTLRREEGWPKSSGRQFVGLIYSQDERIGGFARVGWKKNTKYFHAKVRSDRDGSWSLPLRPGSLLRESNAFAKLVALKITRLVQILH
jgi:hypothetical protein